MLSKVKDLEFFDQSFVERLIMECRPDYKINNVVPFYRSTHNAEGVSPLPVLDSVLYYGYVSVAENASVVMYDLNGQLTAYFLPSQPILFKGTQGGEGNNFVFTGWKITLENAAQSTLPPTPPSAFTMDNGAVYFWLDALTDKGKIWATVRDYNRHAEIKVYDFGTTDLATTFDIPVAAEYNDSKEILLVDWTGTGYDFEFYDVALGTMQASFGLGFPNVLPAECVYTLVHGSPIGVQVFSMPPPFIGMDESASKAIVTLMQGATLMTAPEVEGVLEIFNGDSDVTTGLYDNTKGLWAYVLAVFVELDGVTYRQYEYTIKIADAV